MITTKSQAIVYLSKNLSSIDESYNDFPEETLEVLFMERFIEKLWPVISQEQSDHLGTKEDMEWYDAYMREYLAQYIPNFYELLTETITEMIHEVQKGMLVENI